MNLCKDCRHHTEDFTRYGDDSLRSYYSHNCHFLDGTDHPVTGGKVDSPVDCSAMRLGPCGLDGKLFITK